MTLNTYLVLAVLVLILLSPLFLLTSPVWVPWLIVQRRTQRRLGYRALLPFMAGTIENYAKLMIRGDAPGGDWANVSRNLDRYIAETRSPRIWRLQLMCLIMEVAPILRFQLPFSLLSTRAREAFIENNLKHGRGLMRVVSMGRQLVRLCYYASESTHRRMGFVPMKQRAAWRRESNKLTEVAA